MALLGPSPRLMSPLKKPAEGDRGARGGGAWAARLLVDGRGSAVLVREWECSNAGSNVCVVDAVE